jgi:hypothetical protein
MEASVREARIMRDEWLRALAWALARATRSGVSGEASGDILESSKLTNANGSAAGGGRWGLRARGGGTGAGGSDERSFLGRGPFGKR